MSDLRERLCDARPRRSRLGAGRAPPRVTASQRSIAMDAPAAAAAINQFAGCVLAVPDFVGGLFSTHDLDMLAAARRVADTLGVSLVGILFREATGATWADAGLDGLLNPASVGYAPEADTRHLVDIYDRFKPSIVIAPDTIPGAGDTARRLAASRGLSVQGHIVKARGDIAVAQRSGSRTEFVTSAPQVLLVAADCADHGATTRRQPIVLTPPVSAIDSGCVLSDEGLAPADWANLALEEADFIVAGGGGVRDWEALRRLADLLGATLGATRVACDGGAAPRRRQIGASGAIVKPRCYLAFGVSGAPQHLQGIGAARTIIAVNTDPSAPLITQRADLAVIADADATIAALVDALRADERP